MTSRAAGLLLVAIPAILFLSGAAMAMPLGPTFLDHPTGFRSLVANKCPKGEVWKCEKLSAAVKALGYKECRCLRKGRSGH